MIAPLYLQRVTRARPCAICGKADRCGYDPRAGIAACSRTASERPHGAWGWLHTVDPSAHEYDASAVRDQAQRKPLDAWEAAGRDLLYHHMAGHRHCVLTPADRSGFHQRGLDDVTIRRRGYFAYPTKAQAYDVAHQVNAYAERGTDARRYLGTHGHALSTVWWSLPGVYTKGYRNGRGVATLFAGPPQGALALPVRNVAGQIVALRLRLRDGEIGPKDSRYKWLSSKDNPSGAPCHIARPSGAHDPTRVIITEGELKADIASDRLNCIVVAVPGIDIYQDVPGILDELRSRGDLDADARVIVAYDSDATTKPQVASARDRLANLLAQPPRAEQVTIATWDTAYKGLDDLVVAGGTFTEARHVPKARRALVDLPAVAPAPDVTYQSLDDAELAIRERVALLLPVRHWDATPGHHVITATMGVGKTAAVLRRIATLLNGLGIGPAWPMVPTAKGERPIRALYLCDTTEQLMEKSKQYLHAEWVKDKRTSGEITERRWVWKQRKDDRFHIMEGRNPFSQSASFCENPRAAEVGNRRHLAARDVCGNAEHPCPFHMDCEIKGYLANKETVRTARFVMATKASYLNGSDEIGDFDCIIFDEDVTAHLVETVQVTRDDVSQWRLLLNQRDTAGEYSLLDDCLAWWEAAAAHAAARATKGRDGRALDALRATAPENVITLLQAARGSCRETVKSTPRAVCETPIPHAPVPLRAIYDLAGEMLTEWQRPLDADSRLRYSAGGALVMRMPRVDALAHLASARVIYLDATAHEPTMRRLLDLSGHAVPLTLHRFEVAMPVAVITVTDSLFSRDTLARDGGAMVRAIDATLAAIAAAQGVEAAQVAALTFKTFNPTDRGADLPLSAFSCGHWGKDDKATDRFADCQILATIGNYTPNIGVLEATVEALRFAESPPRAAEAFRRVIAYPGTSRGIERECHPDPEVQEAIDHATWMHETQALGRLRAVRRAGPFLWVRFNNAPYRDLVSELVTLDELRARYDLPPLFANSPRREALAHENEKRQRRARQQCLMTWQRLIREGKIASEITQTMLCRESGVCAASVRQWLAWQQLQRDESEGVRTDDSDISIPVRPHTPTYPPDIGPDPRPAHAPPPDAAYATVGARMPRSYRVQHLLDHGYSRQEAERQSWQEWKDVG